MNPLIRVSKNRLPIYFWRPITHFRNGDGTHLLLMISDASLIWSRLFIYLYIPSFDEEHLGAQVADSLPAA